MVREEELPLAFVGVASKEVARDDWDRQTGRSAATCRTFSALLKPEAVQAGIAHRHHFLGRSCAEVVSAAFRSPVPGQLGPWRFLVKLLARNTFRWLAVAAVLAPVLAVAQFATAQEIKPVAVISVASVEDMLADVGYITKAAGQEEIGRTAILFGNAFTGGFDKKKPIGAYVIPQGGDFQVIGFIPVTDLNTILTTYEAQLGKPKDAGDGVLEVGMGESVFIKEQTGWAFVARDKEHLVGLPADPSTLLGTLPKDYNLAVRVMANNVPEEIKRWAVDQVKVAYERESEKLIGDASPEEREAYEKLGRNSVSQFVRYIEEMEEATIGFNIDPVAKKTYFDVSLLAKDGTALARQFAMNTGLKSAFGGFKLPEASVTFNFGGKLAPEDIDQTLAMITTMKAQAHKQIDDDGNIEAGKKDAYKEIATKVIDVLNSTVKSGKLDGGAALVLEPKNINFVAGGYIADGAALEAAFRKVAEVGKDDPEFPKVTFDVGTHGGTKFHTIAYPIPDSEPEMQEFFGPTMDIVLGTAANHVYLAFGKNAQPLIKKVMDQSATVADREALPLELNIALLPILKFFSSVDDNPIVPALVAALEKAGNDKIALTSTASGRGVVGRFEIGEGILQMVGEIGKSFGGGAIPGALLLERN